jgi:hypothetical protein
MMFCLTPDPETEPAYHGLNPSDAMSQSKLNFSLRYFGDRDEQLTDTDLSGDSRINHPAQSRLDSEFPDIRIGGFLPRERLALQALMLGSVSGTDSRGE